jgi:hypothetical protein
VAVNPEVAELAALLRFSRASVGKDGGRPVPPAYYTAVTTTEGASMPDQSYADAREMATGVVMELAGSPLRKETPQVADFEDRRGGK